MSEEDDFKNEFFQEVHARAGAGEQFLEDAFFEGFTEYVVDSGDLSTADRVFYTNQRGIRVDGYGGDPAAAEGVLTLIALDFSGTSERMTLTQTDLNADAQAHPACPPRNFLCPPDPNHINPSPASCKK